MRTSRLILSGFVIVALIITGCGKLTSEKKVTVTFRKLIMALQDKDYYTIDDLIHPKSPFRTEIDSKELRTRFWMLQSFKLASAGGQIDTMGTKNSKGKMILKYRLKPTNIYYEPFEASLAFVKEGNDWKLWVPREGAEIVPIEIGGFEKEKTFINEFESSDGTVFKVETKTTPGMTKQDWIEKLSKKEKEKEMKKKLTAGQPPPSSQ